MDSTSEQLVSRVAEERAAATLVDYASVPIVFTATTPGGTFRKDYDAVDHPSGWPARFDLANWGFFAARTDDNDHRIGSAAVAFGSPNLDMLDGRMDLAVLWDIRVAPAARRQGVGSALMWAVEAWARGRGCRELKVETQDNNVAACRFYQRHGFALRASRAGVYPEFPHEKQLLWYKRLLPASSREGFV